MIVRWYSVLLHRGILWSPRVSVAFIIAARITCPPWTEWVIVLAGPLMVTCPYRKHSEPRDNQFCRQSLIGVHRSVSNQLCIAGRVHQFTPAVRSQCLQVYQPSWVVKVHHCVTSTANRSSQWRSNKVDFFVFFTLLLVGVSAINTVVYETVANSDSNKKMLYFPHVWKVWLLWKCSACELLN